MVGTTYTFDEESATFYYFLMTLTGFYVFPATYSLLKPMKNVEVEPISKAVESRTKAQLLSASQAAQGIQVDEAGRVRRKVSLLRIAALMAGWIVFVYSLYAAYHTKVTDKLYDPFEILGVSHSASDDEVKGAFKRLTRQYHPDKVKEQDKEAAREKFVEISKAYKALTDEVIRRNWEEYGNPDGIRSFSLGVALPAFLVNSTSSSVAVVLLYCILFGLGLPLFLRRWWSKHRVYTKDGIRHSTMALFFRDLKENSSMMRLVEILASASEFSEEMKPVDKRGRVMDALNELETRLKAMEVSCSNDQVMMSASARRAFLLLMAHFRNVSVDDCLLGDQRFVISRSMRMVQGLMTIASAREWFSTTISCMNLTQFLVQGLWDGDGALMQLPFVNQDVIKAMGSVKGVDSIASFMDLERSKRRQLMAGLKEEEFKDLERIACTFPHIRLDKLSFRVLGQSGVVPNGLVTCQISLFVEFSALASDDDAAVDSLSDESDDDEDADEKEGDLETFEFDEDGNLLEEKLSLAVTNSGEKTPPRPVYCPRYPEVKRPFWWVALVNKSSNGFVCEPVKVCDLVDRKTITMQFKAPPRPMTVSMYLMVRGDFAIDAGFTKEVKFTVVQPVDDVDSDASWGISDDEDDSVSFD